MALIALPLILKNDRIFFGDIEVESEVGNGATFRIKLPIESQNQTTEGKAQRT